MSSGAETVHQKTGAHGIRIGIQRFIELKMFTKINNIYRSQNRFSDKEIVLFSG